MQQLDRRLDATKFSHNITTLNKTEVFCLCLMWSWSLNVRFRIFANVFFVLIPEHSCENTNVTKFSLTKMFSS